MNYFSKDELKQAILAYATNTTRKRRVFYFMKNEPWFNELSHQFDELGLPQEWNTMRKLWHWWNNVKEVPLCSISGRERNWRAGGCTDRLDIPGFKEGYSKFADITVSVKQTAQLAKQSVQAKYGVDNVFQLETTKQKTKETLLRKYGVEYISQNKDIIVQRENTMMSKFGFRTNFENHENFMIAKYGFRNAAHIPEIAEVACLNRFKKRHEYILETGEIILLQGYESFGLDFLKNKYQESEVSYRKKDMPLIMWFNNKTDKEHRYYPDFYVNKDNLVVEIKSDYTYKKDYENIRSKYTATVNNGHQYLLLVFAGDGSLILVRNSVE